MGASLFQPGDTGAQIEGVLSCNKRIFTSAPGEFEAIKAVPSAAAAGRHFHERNLGNFARAEKHAVVGQPRPCGLMATRFARLCDPVGTRKEPVGELIECDWALPVAGPARLQKSRE
jgi:hypothetical protein